MANHEEIGSMLTTSDVAHLLNVHINTVRRWTNKGTLKTTGIGAIFLKFFYLDFIFSYLHRFFF